MNNNYFRIDNNNKRLKIIFLIIILSVSAITNIFSISSVSFNFAFLKDVQALENKKYIFESEKKKQKGNNYYKDSNFANNRYLSSSIPSISSEFDLSPTSLELDRNNNYYNNNHKYKSIIANIEKEIIKCNNLNVNLNGNGGKLTTSEDIYDNQNNNNILGQILESNQQNEIKETAINSDNNKLSSYYESEDKRFSVICKNLNVNEVLQQPTSPSPESRETLTVIKDIECQADTKICEQLQIQSSQFNIVIEEGKNPSDTNFPGSSTGTNIQLEPGAYLVSEEGIDPIIPAICNTMGFDAGREASDLGENLFICTTNFSAECEGDIAIGNPRICYIKNVIFQENVFGNHVYVTWWAWGETTPSDVFFTSSNDNGKTFSTPIIISDNKFGGGSPKITAVGSNVYVTYTAAVLDRNDIFFTSSNDNGKTFSTPINLSNNSGNSDESQITAVGSNVYIAWTDTTSSIIDFLFTSSNDNGKTFSTPINLNNDSGNSYAPQISAVGNNVYVTYFSDIASGNQDVFFTSSNDNGKTFSNPVNLSNNSRISTNPQISSYENNVYVVWYDFTPDNFEIFFTGKLSISDIINMH